MMYLKRSVIIAVLLLIQMINSFGQVPFSFGIRTGLNFSSASTKGFGSLSTKVGLLLGGSLEIGLSNAIFIQPEIFYIQKGAEEKEQLTIVTFKYKFDYIEMLALLKIKFSTGDFRPYIFGGPNMGLRIMAKAESLALVFDLKNRIKNTDVAFDIGIGGEYSLNKKTSLAGDIRYSLGLNNILIEPEEGSWKSTGVQIILGLIFSL